MNYTLYKLRVGIQVEDIWKGDQKIRFIKALRTATGAGLQESKSILDNLVASEDEIYILMDSNQFGSLLATLFTERESFREVSATIRIVEIITEEYQPIYDLT